MPHIAAKITMQNKFYLRRFKMSEKKGFDEKLNNFFTGKGFYIVLSLCLIVIGVSTYYLLSTRKANVEEPETQMANTEAAPPHKETVLPRDTPVTLPEDEPEAPVINEEDEPVMSTEGEAGGENDTPVWNEQQAEAAAAAPFIWPLEGEVTLPYSVTSLIYHEKFGDWRTHDSVEISAPLGTQVQAVSTGKVESVAFDDMGGMTVVIEHAGGIRSIYSNLAAVPTVYEGDNVMTGEVIGSVGTTAPGETAEAPTLHLKMTLDGQSVNPIDYLPER